jgi:hypothetical protein
MDSLEGGLNRRLVVLALPFIQRRTNSYTPDGSLIEVERRMGFRGIFKTKDTSPGQATQISR